MRPVSVSFSGPPGCGKSHVAMTFPDPITVIDYDGGLEDVLPKFPEKDVKVINFHLPSTVKTRKAGEKIKMEKVYGENEFEQFMEQYSAELDEGRAQTIVIDTASTLKSVVTAAQKKQHRRRFSCCRILVRQCYLLLSLPPASIFSKPSVLLRVANGALLSTLL